MCWILIQHLPPIKFEHYPFFCLFLAAWGPGGSPSSYQGAAQVIFSITDRNTWTASLLWLPQINQHPIKHMWTFNQRTICLIWCLPASFQQSSFSFPSSALFISMTYIIVLLSWMFLLSIRQAKVQILPERILPDPLSAVQLTPLSRLHIQPSSKPQTESCKQTRCWWNNSQQVGHTKTRTCHTSNI